MAHLHRFAFFITLALITVSCGRGFQTSSSPLDLSSSSDQGSETPTEPPATDPATPAEPPTPPQPFQYEALAWEKTQPDGKNWSAYAFKLLQNEAKAILTAQDMSRFCRRYPFLNESQKINVAGQLIAGIVAKESNFNPLSRFPETTMGKDPVTGLPVWSEGLMQLSYQDIQWAPYCAFNWAVDKNLPVDSPKKTILDPYKNLYCGMRILANQVTRKGSIVLSSGAYWSVIMESGRYEKIDEIVDIVSRLKVCQ